MTKLGTKRVLEYARLAMGFANVRASRYGIRLCSGGYSSTDAGAGAGWEKSFRAYSIANVSFSMGW